MRDPNFIDTDYTEHDFEDKFLDGDSWLECKCGFIIKQGMLSGNFMHTQEFYSSEEYKKCSKFIS